MPLLRQRNFFPLVENEAVAEPSTAGKTMPEASFSDLLSYPNIPRWNQDNKFIRDGYRRVTNSTSACFASWLYLHNETVNIYSHLLPGILFLASEGVVCQYLHARYPKATTGDYVVFAFFLLTAVICLGMSAMYHTLMNHSEQVSSSWLRLDFVGIIVLTLGDFVSGIFMIFYCEPVLQRIYWAMITTLSLAAICIIVHPRCQGLRWRTLRVGIFVGTGLSGFAPLIHGIKVFGFSPMWKHYGMAYYLGEGLLLILGAFFYMLQIPESLRPGKFDIFGSSHQIFHVLVVFATVVQLAGMFSAFDYNYHYRTCYIS